MTDLRTLRAASIFDRLELNSIPEPNSGCLLWLGSVNSHGYGQAISGGRTHLMHRVAWERSHGPIPIGMHVLHKCDVRSCGEEKHLFLGTNRDNVTDKMRKGRGSRKGIPGEGNSHAKLTDAQVVDIRARGLSNRQIRETYHVGRSCADRARKGLSFRHLLQNATDGARPEGAPQPNPKATEQGPSQNCSDVRR